jgi:hypothetical protein
MRPTIAAAIAAAGFAFSSQTFALCGIGHLTVGVITDTLKKKKLRSSLLAMRTTSSSCYSKLHCVLALSIASRWVDPILTISANTRLTPVRISMSTPANRPLKIVHCGKFQLSDFWQIPGMPKVAPFLRGGRRALHVLTERFLVWFWKIRH